MESKSPVKYTETEATLAELRSKADLLPKTVDSLKSRKCVADFVSECKSLRVGVDKHRKALGEEAREYLSYINTEGKRIIEDIRITEQSEKDKIEAYDSEKARIKAEAEKKERDRVDEIMNRIDCIQRSVLCEDEDIPHSINVLTAMDPKVGYDEFAGQACEAMETALAALRKRQEQIKEEEARQESLRAEQEALRIQQEAFEAEKAKAAAEQAERERIQQAKVEAEKEEIRKQQEIEQAKVEAEKKLLAEQRRHMEAQEAARIQSQKEAEAKKAAEDEKKNNQAVIAKCRQSAIDDLVNHTEVAITVEIAESVVAAIEAGHIENLSFNL